MIRASVTVLCFALMIVLFYVSGKSLITGRLSQTESRGFSFETLLGFSVFSATALLLMRCGLSITYGGFAGILLCLILSYVGRRHIISATLNAHITLGTLISISFAALVLAALLPLSIGHGTVYAPPPIYDLPKHLLAITSLSGTDHWPPTNPLYPTGDFAYNYLFYILPAFLKNVGHDYGSQFITFPIQTAIFAGLYVSALGRLSSYIGVPYQHRWIAILFATFVGGLHPLILHDSPAMGYQLGSVGFLDREVWGEDPIVYATYIPQHVFTIIISLIGLCVCINDRNQIINIAIAAVIFFSASTSSLILLPHANGIFAIGILISLMRHRPWLPSQLAIFGAVLLAYALCLWIFVEEAHNWASSTTQFVSWQKIGKTDFYLFTTYGLVGLIGIFGITLAACRDEYVWYTAPLSIVALSLYISTIFLSYPDAGIKSAAALRMVLVIFAAAGTSRILIAFPHKSIRVALTLACAGSVIIGLPFIMLLIQWHKNSTADKIGLSLMQQAKGPLLIDDGAQWDAALAGRPVTMDFRGYRADSYLPPRGGRDASAFFDRLHNGDPQTIVGAATANNMVVTTPARIPLWHSQFGEPVLTGPSRVIFERHRDARDSHSP